MFPPYINILILFYTLKLKIKLFTYLDNEIVIYIGSN